MKLFWMMLAGSFGVAARYGLTLCVQKWMEERNSSLALLTFLGPSFPLGTFLVNILGSFLLSFLTTLVLQGAVRPEWRLILGTGFLGAFTTFSTFELETQELIASGAKTTAALYVTGSVLLGLSAILLGRFTALRLFNLLLKGHMTG